MRRLPGAGMQLVRRLVADGAKLDVIDSNGLSPSTTRWAGFRKEFNALLPEPYPETVALLRSLGRPRKPDSHLRAGTDPQDPAHRALTRR